MRIHYSSSLPDGELPARMNGYDDGSMFGVIDLDGSDLCLDTPEDARRLLEAAARIVGWYEFDGRPHEYLRLTTSTHCAVCGLLKSRHPEPAPVITDSERTCPEVNNGEHCTRGGDHGVHRDSNGDEWRTDGTATVTGERCLEHSDPADDLYGQCVKYGPHKMHENVHHQQWSKPFRPAPAPSPAGGPFWCPATTGPDDELDVTLYCDRDAGHPGSHHAPGPDEGSEVVWSDEPASVTS